jgi:hypothetical protein
MENHAEINRMKATNEDFGFQLFGFNSRKSFSRIEKLFEYLTGYKSFGPLLAKPRSKKSEEFIQNLIILKAPQAEMLDFTGKKEREKQKLLTLGVRVNRGDSKAKKRATQPAWKKEQYKAKRRAQAKARRDKRKA